MLQNKKVTKKCLTCGEDFAPFKKSSFCPKCLHKQLTERQGILRRRHFKSES